MKLEFELKKHDLHEFYKFHHWYSDDKKKFRIKTRLSAGFILFLIPVFFNSIDGNPFNLESLLNLLFTGFILFFIAFYLVKELTISKIERSVNVFLKKGKNQDLLGLRTMVFKDDVLLCNSENSESKINYKMIEKVRQDSKYYYVYVNALSAYSIPKILFQAESEKVEFNEILNRIEALK